MPPCKQDCKTQHKICNEKTGRCIYRDGRVAQVLFGKRDCREDCEKIGKICNKTTGNCIKTTAVKKSPKPPLSKAVSDEMKMYMVIESYFERANAPVLPLESLKKFREEIIKTSGIRKARTIVDWKAVVKSFKTVGRKFGVDVKKFNEVLRDRILIRLTSDAIGDKYVIY